MKKIIYYTTEGGPFESIISKDIPRRNLHSPNEETPAIIYPSGTKKWYFEGKRHRLTGPAIIYEPDDYDFCLNGIVYEFKEWVHNHPNINLYLEANGYVTDAQKALWKLKNL